MKSANSSDLGTHMFSILNAIRTNIPRWKEWKTLSDGLISTELTKQSSEVYALLLYTVLTAYDNHHAPAFPVPGSKLI
jgi:hypothetical protein